jgi:hypothetical protein
VTVLALVVMVVLSLLFPDKPKGEEA